MRSLFHFEVNLVSFINPFFLYGISFLLALFVYCWGWSDIFPALSSGLILFLVITILIFLYSGILIKKKKLLEPGFYRITGSLSDYIFLVIICLGILNVLWMGYLPIIDRSHNYREFGMPVIDPVFNTLSIFFSVFFFQGFLQQKKKRYLIYLLLILLFQVLIFRRSTVVWILTGSSFLYILNQKRIKAVLIVAFVALIPLFSYYFGLFGSARSHLTSSFVINDLKASESFRSLNISPNHYLTYLYVSSPLANLQENIDKSESRFNKENLRIFLFYCMVPESITMRLQNRMNMTPPACRLVMPELLAGSFYMVAFYTLGWYGMALMFLYLMLLILTCLLLIKRWDIFRQVTLSLLCTTVALLIFSNFLNRLDVLLILFIYPVLFHFIFSRSGKTEPVAV
jgi:hypothetical protein